VIATASRVALAPRRGIWLRVLVLAGTWASLFGPTLPAKAAETISGKVIMGTPGGSLPTDLEVSVVELSSSGGQVIKKVVPTPDGAFSFEADPANRYLVGALYRGVTYSTPVEREAAGGLELRIFETTHDPAVITVASDTTTILKGRDDIFEVLQLLLVRNTSDRTFAGTTEAQNSSVLTVPVPEGAFDVSPADESNPLGISFSGRGVAVSSPILPGETSIPYVFKVRVPRTGWQLRREVIYPTQRADLLVGEGLELKGAPGFDFDEQVTLEGRTYRRYRSGQLIPGSVIGADLGFPTASLRSLWWGLATGLAVLAALFFGFSVMRRRRPSRAPAAGGEEERNTLIEEIARLDDRFEEGLLAENDYRSTRNQMLARLSVLPRSSGGSPPGPATPK
jgi:hypothetical protein